MSYEETLEKLLRTYMRHVANCEGSDFLDPVWTNDLISLGLTPEEVDTLLSIAEEEWIAHEREP